MQLKYAILSSKDPASCPYPGAHEVSLRPPFLFLLNAFLCYPPNYASFSQAISFPWVLPTRALYAFIFSPYMSLAPPYHSSCFDLSCSIFCGVKIMRRLLMPFCPVFCRLSACNVQVFSSAPYYRTPSV